MFARIPARIVDWSLALCTAVAFATGLTGNLTGTPVGRWIFVAHGIAGFVLALFLVPKLRRVLPRIAHLPWDSATSTSVLTTLLTFVTLGTGVAWVTGVHIWFMGFELLNWHVTIGFVVVAVLSAHMVMRAKPVRRRDLSGRRQAVRWLGIAAVGAAIWPVQQRITASERRFTGSREMGSFGGEYPPTSWVSDAPRPLDLAMWRLDVGGHVARPFAVGYTDLRPDASYDATLDCTGGFFTTQTWHGVRVGTLLDRAGIDTAAGWVRFRSVTGYRWSLPLDEARHALLATHTTGSDGGDLVPLSYGHGAPMRLIAPGRRGFQWVKWVVAVEVLVAPDIAQALAIHTSSYTPAGKGEV